MTHNEGNRSDVSSARRGTGTLDGDRLRQQVEQKLGQAVRPSSARAEAEMTRPAVSSSQQAGVLLLPQAAAPSLEALHVRVPRGPEITREDLLMRLHEHVRAHGARRPRKPGEPVAMGDTVVLDILGYADGRLIPFSARGQLEMELAPQAMLPGFAEALVGAPIGGGRQMELVLPDGYPVESLRGVEAHFLVDVISAEQVQPLDAESAEFLGRFRRGKTLEQALASLADELADERASELWIEAQERVIDEIVGRTEVAMTPELVDAEICRRWDQAEAPYLRSKNFSPDELEEALTGWLVDPPTRIKTERDLRASLAFKAILERDRLELTPRKLDELLHRAVEPFGLSTAEAREAMNHPEAAARIRYLALQLMAVDHVMSHARIQFEGVEGIFPGRRTPAHASAA